MKPYSIYLYFKKFLIMLSVFGNKMSLQKLADKILKKDFVWLRDLILNRIIIPLFYKKNKGVYILEESWDNMIILDSCRFDVFKDSYRNFIKKGNLECKISRGAHTSLFLIENFSSERNEDIVYITANPHVDKLVRNKFYHIIPVWKDGWNEKLQTVLPETVYNYTVHCLMKYEGKRLIIHFLQPHYPYIGFVTNDDSLRRVRESLLSNVDFISSRKHLGNLFTVYGADIYALIDKDKHFEVYKKNLDFVLPYVEKLINILPGRTVVTADHGEAFGEKIHPLIPIKVYGHISTNYIGIRTPSVIKVPWLVVDAEEKEISPIQQKELNKIKDKLRKQEKEKLRRTIQKIKKDKILI